MGVDGCGEVAVESAQGEARGRARKGGLKGVRSARVFDQPAGTRLVFVSEDAYLSCVLGLW